MTEAMKYHIIPVRTRPLHAYFTTYRNTANNHSCPMWFLVLYCNCGVVLLELGLQWYRGVRGWVFTDRSVDLGMSPPSSLIRSLMLNLLLLSTETWKASFTLRRAKKTQSCCIRNRNMMKSKIKKQKKEADSQLSITTDIRNLKLRDVFNTNSLSIHCLVSY